jgi:mannosyl-3-phosphoglycerate phosphatase
MKIIITDLDGTLLDKETYSLSAVRPLLNLLREKEIPVIFCTSKTRAEVEFYREKLGNEHPFIVENGGALFIPTNYFPFPLRATTLLNGYALFEFGTPYPQLLKSLKVSAQQSNCPVTGFNDLTAEEVSSQINLPIELAELAKIREYDEPFLIHDVNKTGRLLKNIEDMGLHWTRGGRFYHIHGNNNKGMATKILRLLYREIDSQITTIALGDSLNDQSLLEIADFPIVVQSGADSELLAAVLHAPLTQDPGPQGWNQAIRELLYWDLCKAP